MLSSHNQECCIPACSDTSSIFDPRPSESYLPIQIHLPGPDPNSPTFWPWIGLSPTEGDVSYKKRHRCHVYTYPDARAGFAEHKPSNYSIKDNGPHDDDRIGSQLAWSRALGCLRHAFGAGSNWPVDDIETVWEEYWRRLMGDLDKVKSERVKKGAAGSAVDVVLRSGNNRLSQGGGMDLLDEQIAKVVCAPTKAGGKIESLSNLIRYIGRIGSNILTYTRIYSGGSEDFLCGRIHTCWPTESAHSAFITDCWR
jgi:hypothetical protein